MNRTEQRTVLEAFSRTLNKEAHNLRQWPELLWQQMYNRLQWADGEEKDGPVTEAIQPEFESRSSSDARSRLHLMTQSRESEALIHRTPLPPI